MKFKKMMMTGTVIVFLLLVEEIIRFDSENKIAEEIPTEAEPIRVLAPYKAGLQRQILNEIAKEYGNRPGNPQVEVEFLNREVYKKELCLRMDSGENTDLIICDGAVMPALIDMGVFQDISDYVTVEKKNSIRYQSLWDLAKSNGKYFGIPFTCDPYMLFYNRDILDEKELTIPEDWDGLLELSQSVQNLGSKGFGFPAQSQDERTTFFYYLLYSMGGNFRNLSGDSGVRSLDFIKTLRSRKNISDNSINWSKEDLVYAFARGEINMMANSLSSINILRSTRINFDIGVTTLPKDVKNSCILRGENIGITAQAKEEAKDFLAYLYQPEVMERVTYAMDTIPLLQGEEYRVKRIRPDIGAKLPELFENEGYGMEAYDAWFEISATISEGVYQMLGSDKKDETKDLAALIHEKVRTSIIEK